MASYSAQVDEQVAEAKALMLAVRRESVQRHIEIMQTPLGAGGNLRVDTGFLRASLRTAIGSANFAITYKPDDENARYTFDPSDVSLVIAGAEIDDPIEAVYTANYARPREYGARGQPGDRWVGLAAQRWVQTVESVVAEVKARNGR